MLQCDFHEFEQKKENRGNICSLAHRIQFRKPAACLTLSSENLYGLLIKHISDMTGMDSSGHTPCRLSLMAFYDIVGVLSGQD